MRRLASFRWALAAIVVLALVVRIIVVLASPDFRPETDAADYDREGFSLAEHGRFPASLLVPTGGPTAFRPPLFPLALAATYRLTGPPASPRARWRTGRLMQAGLGAAAVLLLALIALRLWGEAVALGLGGLAAVYPPLLLAGSSLMSESLFIPLTLAAVLAALHTRGSPRPLRWAPLAGVLTGCAALTRSNGVVLVLPVALLVWTVPRRRGPALLAPAVVVAATALTLVPWTIRNLDVFGQFIPISTESGYAIAGTYNPVAQDDPGTPAMWVPPVNDIAPILRAHRSLNEAELSDRLVATGVRYALDHPGSLPRTVYWSGLRLLDLTGTGIEQYAARYESYPRWLAETSVYAFWLLLVGLVAALLAGGLRRAPWALWLCPAMLLLSVLPWSGLTRYRVPADPFLLLLVTAGVVAHGTGHGALRPGRRRAGHARNEVEMSGGVPAA